MDYALHLASLQTPVGTVLVRGTADHVTGVTIAAVAQQAEGDAPADSPAAEAVRQIGEYFAGTRHAFDLPLAPAATPRGGALRAAIASVPYGSTVTYGTLARTHGSAARAVGQACARNPFPIIIPCHRVTSSPGAKENYSGGQGVVTKSLLLDHEARHGGERLI